MSLFRKLKKIGASMLPKLLLLFLLLQAGGLFANDIRIISLAASLTKQIYLLESQADLVGCTSYCELAKKDDIQVVASAIDVNIEKVLSLKPDVILATTITKQNTITTLEKLGFKVAVFPTPISFDDVCKQFIEIGKSINKENAALKIVEDERQNVKELRKRINPAIKPRIFVEVGAKPLFTTPANTYMHDLVVKVGGTNIAEDLTSGSINREVVLHRNPDAIMIVTMGMVAKDEKEVWGKYPELNAVKNKKIFIVDADQACSPTPVDFRKTLADMIEVLY